VSSQCRVWRRRILPRYRRSLSTCSISIPASGSRPEIGSHAFRSGCECKGATSIIVRRWPRRIWSRATTCDCSLSSSAAVSGHGSTRALPDATLPTAGKKASRGEKSGLVDSIAAIPCLFINILASYRPHMCKLFIFCKILAWRGDDGLFRDFGALNSSYLLHFHQYIGMKDKLFIFKNILAI